jgi:hypothetical protein
MTDTQQGAMRGAVVAEVEVDEVDSDAADLLEMVA